MLAISVDGIRRAAGLVHRLLPLLLIAAAWESAALAKLLPDYVIPPLSSILVRLISLMREDLPVEAARTLARLAAGLGGAVAVGLALGLAMARLRLLRSLLDPVLRSLYPLPKTALIPLVILWLGLGAAANIVLVFIGCLLPVVVATYNAAREVDQTLLWSGRFLGASEAGLIRDVVIPVSLPQILNGIRTALSLAFVLVISAELVISQSGLGYFIYLMADNGDYPGMFAGIITITVLGFAADHAFQLSTSRLVFWAEQQDAG